MMFSRKVLDKPCQKSNKNWREILNELKLMFILLYILIFFYFFKIKMLFSKMLLRTRTKLFSFFWTLLTFSFLFVYTSIAFFVRLWSCDIILLLLTSKGKMLHHSFSSHMKRRQIFLYASLINKQKRKVTIKNQVLSRIYVTSDSYIGYNIDVIITVLNQYCLSKCYGLLLN